MDSEIYRLRPNHIKQIPQQRSYIGKKIPKKSNDLLQDQTRTGNYHLLRMTYQERERGVMPVQCISYGTLLKDMFIKQF
jgi:hypothetical protein